MTFGGKELASLGVKHFILFREYRGKRQNTFHIQKKTSSAQILVPWLWKYVEFIFSTPPHKNQMVCPLALIILKV